MPEYPARPADVCHPRYQLHVAGAGQRVECAGAIEIVWWLRLKDVVLEIVLLQSVEFVGRHRIGDATQVRDGTIATEVVL